MNKSKGKKSNVNKIRSILIIVLTFIIGFNCGMVCTTILNTNGVDTIQALKNTNNNNEDNISNENASNDSILTDIITTEVNNTTAETTITEITTIETTISTNFDSPLNNEYPDMYVEKVPFNDDTTGDKVVYLTFDDGPCKNTPQLLNLLDQYNIKVTFFVTAQYLKDDELLQSLQEIHEHGHAIAVHTYSHDYNKIYSSVENYLTDYYKMDSIILQATGERSHIFRFPGGSNAKYSNDIRNDLLTEMNARGFVYHDWNAYDGGCDNYSINGMISKAVGEASAHDKSVLLMHDTKSQDFILQTLPSIITQLQDLGYRFDKLDATVKPYQFETIQGESALKETTEIVTSESIETEEVTTTIESEVNSSQEDSLIHEDTFSQDTNNIDVNEF